MSGSRFLERWSRLKKAAETASTVEIQDAESLLAQLGPDSDFGQFLRQEISEEVRRKAMKTLFADPHFNVMDGLDIYIDDYTSRLLACSSVRADKSELPAAISCAAVLIDSDASLICPTTSRRRSTVVLVSSFN